MIEKFLRTLVISIGIVSSTYFLSTITSVSPIGWCIAQSYAAEELPSSTKDYLLATLHILTSDNKKAIVPAIIATLMKFGYGGFGILTERNIVIVVGRSNIDSTSKIMAIVTLRKQGSFLEFRLKTRSAFFARTDDDTIKMVHKILDVLKSELAIYGIRAIR